MEFFFDFLSFLEALNGDEVYIQTHNFPDPDAIASAFGLKMLLEYYGIHATICYEGRIDRTNTRKLTKLFGIEMHAFDEIKGEISDTAKIICIDSQKGSGNLLDDYGEQIACIDHHPVLEAVDYVYKDVRITGACATLIADYYRQFKIPMTQDVATALLYGLKMDTLNFQRGVTALDIEMFGYLFPKIHQKKLDILEKNTLELEDLRAFSAVIDSIVVYKKAAFAKIPFGCPDAMIATVSDFIMTVEEIEVAVIYSYRNDGIKISVRSMNKRVHAGILANKALCEVGNGGGHSAMAGGFVAKEDQWKLGEDIDAGIKKLFVDAIRDLTQK